MPLRAQSSLTIQLPKEVWPSLGPTPSHVTIWTCDIAGCRENVNSVETAVIEYLD